MEKDPAKRFSSASEFRESLLEAASVELARFRPVGSARPKAPAPSPPPEPAPEQTPKPELAVAADATPVPAEWAQGSGDMSRLVGVGIAAFSVGLLIFLGGMILLGQ